MARPSDVYPSERPGKPCGASWPDPLKVTGKIPNVPFGAQFKITLKPVALANDMRANQGMLSWRGAHEDRVRAALETTIDQVLADAEKFRWRIGQDNYQAVRNLLSLASAELAYVDITHETWLKRRWGLERVTYAPECDARGGPGPGEVFGGGFDRCPTLEEIELRMKAREFILEKFVDAAHFIRCAQFGLWRVWLYRQARDEWRATPQGGAPKGLAPNPPKKPPSKVGPGIFTAKPPGPPPPPTPPMPPKPEPPPFPADLGGESLPDPGEPDPPDEDDVPSPPLPEPPVPPEPVGEAPPVVEPPRPEPPMPEEGAEEPTPLGSIWDEGDSDDEPERFVAEPLGESPAFTYDRFAESSGHGGGIETELVSDRGTALAHDVVEAGENTVRNVAVAAAVAKVATAAVVVGGIVGVTYLVTRKKA